MAEQRPKNEKPALDLSMSFWERTRGEITVIGTWWRPTRRPCMVLVPTRARQRTHEHIRPCVVLQDHAWLWDEHTGDGTYCARTSMAFAEALFGSTDPHRMISITMAIRDCLGDLLRIPPMPNWDRAIVADIVIKDQEGTTTRRAEVEDDV